MFKKIIILFIFILLLSGCYDYSEINDLAIITAIGIDKNNDNYIITYELLSDNLDKNSANIKSYTVSKKDKIFVRALKKIEENLVKKAYYAHTDVVLLSDDLAKNNLEEILDPLLRNTKLREDFKVFIVDKY